MTYSIDLLERTITSEFETDHIDYKQGFNWDTFRDYHKAKLTKHIAAMSNIPGGGLLIFGVADWKEVTGLSQKDIDSLDRTKIDQFLANYLDPLPSYTIREVEYQEKRLLIFEIEEFREVPIICKHEYPHVLRAGGVYIRHKASSTIIQRSNQMRIIIDLALRKKKQELLSSIEDILGHGTYDDWKL